MPSTRRTMLTSVVAGSVALAGCSRLSRSTSVGDPSPDEPPPAGVDELPDPDGHVAGANGRWSSFGCNAANTRAVADGEAPVDGVSERWRVETTQTTYHEPVVADGTVYLLESQRRLRALDAAGGDELWTIEDVTAPPLVRDDRVYVARRDGIHAIEPETGDRVWEREFDGPGRVTTPSTDAGDELVCGVGERAVALDPDDGERRWERDLFGQLLDHSPFVMGHWVVATTAAGMVFLLGPDGFGIRQWTLPAEPAAPPSADTDAIYVNCRDGTTRALDVDSGGEAAWTAETGIAERGIAVADGLVLVANVRGLHALSSDTGDRYWTRDVGDWRHTAPAYGRETVFVGGDRLRAFDPAPGENPGNGPALRFEREFAGRVGPGPVLDGGTLYVVAEVGEGEYALLALE